MRYGVVEERAFSMSRGERLARIIINGQVDGGEWDWHAMTWKPRAE